MRPSILTRILPFFVDGGHTRHVCPSTPGEVPSLLPTESDTQSRAPTELDRVGWWGGGRQTTPPGRIGYQFLGPLL